MNYDVALYIIGGGLLIPSAPTLLWNFLERKDPDLQTIVLFVLAILLIAGGAL